MSIHPGECPSTATTQLRAAKRKQQASILGRVVSLLPRDAEYSDRPFYLSLERPSDETLREFTGSDDLYPDTYAYVGAKIANVLNDCIQQEEPFIVMEPYTQQLGLSLMMRLLDKGMLTYVQQSSQYSLEELNTIMVNSFDLVQQFSRGDDPFGQRLEILYQLSKRSSHSDFALEVRRRHTFALQDGQLTAPTWDQAQTDAQSHTGLDPVISSEHSGYCPADLPASKVGETNVTALRTLWGIAIRTCTTVPWLWRGDIAQMVGVPPESL